MSRGWTIASNGNTVQMQEHTLVVHIVSWQYVKVEVSIVDQVHITAHQGHVMPTMDEIYILYADEVKVYVVATWDWVRLRHPQLTMSI